jgi:hypothetical protein
MSIGARFLKAYKYRCYKHKEMTYFHCTYFDFCTVKAFLLCNVLSYSRISVLPQLDLPAIWAPLLVTFHIQDSLSHSGNDNVRATAECLACK